MRVFQGVRGATASRVVVRAAGCACTVRTTVAACPVTNVTRKSVCRRGRICRPGEQTRLTGTLGALVAEAVGLRAWQQSGVSRATVLHRLVTGYLVNFWMILIASGCSRITMYTACR
jgi:hypothetical protein